MGNSTAKWKNMIEVSDLDILEKCTHDNYEEMQDFLPDDLPILKIRMLKEKMAISSSNRE